MPRDKRRRFRAMADYGWEEAATRLAPVPDAVLLDWVHGQGAPARTREEAIAAIVFDLGNRVDEVLAAWQAAKPVASPPPPPARAADAAAGPGSEAGGATTEPAERTEAGPMAGQTTGPMTVLVAGHEAPDLAARVAGHRAGPATGAIAGQPEGGVTGHRAGHTAGDMAGRPIGDTAGHKAGHKAPTEAGHEAGYPAGGPAGAAAGRTTGLRAGNEAGQKRGREAGQRAGPTADGACGPGHGDGWEAGVRPDPDNLDLANMAGPKAGPEEGGKGGREGGEEAGNKAVPTAGRPAGQDADSEADLNAGHMAGQQAGPLTEQEAGVGTGDKTGEQVGQVTGLQARQLAGLQAGDMADSSIRADVAGQWVGQQAGHRAGKLAGPAAAALTAGQKAGPMAGQEEGALTGEGGPSAAREPGAGARGRRGGGRRGALPADLVGHVAVEGGRVTVQLPGEWTVAFPAQAVLRRVPAGTYAERGWPEGLASWLEGRLAVWAVHEPGTRTPRVRRQTLYLRAADVRLLERLQEETAFPAYKLVCLGVEVVGWHLANGLALPEQPAEPVSRKRLGRGLVRLVVPERPTVRRVVYDLPRSAAALLHGLALATGTDVSTCATAGLNALGALLLAD